MQLHPHTDLGIDTDHEHAARLQAELPDVEDVIPVNMTS
jgi:hypothetical protein